MTAVNAPANTNGVVSNGNAVNHETNLTTEKPTEDGLLVTIILTIYDVIIFLGVSIGYIIQVSISFLYF